MDRGQFDTLAKLVWAKQSRRTALGVLLGAVVLRHDPAAVLAKGKGRRTGTAKAHRTATARAAAACYPGTRCAPGPGAYASRCDFAFSTLLRDKDVRGSNLSKSSFAEADLRGADFRGANLSGACFVGADLTGAKLGASVNLRRAVFCRTTMPDGTIDNSGCEGDTPCCHLLGLSCPDAKIECYQGDPDPLGCHGKLAGAFGPVGNCWTFLGGCCPCDHADYAYWENLCNQTFGVECRDCRECTGRCIADQDPVFPQCISFSKVC